MVTRRRRQTASSGETMWEQLVASPRGRAELAAAAIVSQVKSILEDAFETSDVRASDVAAVLGVSEGRISQIRHGDGNLRLSTVAKILSALGREIEIVTHEAHPSTPEQEKDCEEFIQNFVHSEGVTSYVYEVPGSNYTPIGSPQPVKTPASHQQWLSLLSRPEQQWSAYRPSLAVELLYPGHEHGTDAEAARQ